MSSQEHTATPGPWKFDDAPGCRTIKGGKCGRHQQAQYTEIATTVGLSDDDRDRANAKLMAAAPDLLAALKEMTEMYCDMANSGDCGFWDPEKTDEVKHARAAISKATGA